MYAVRKKAGHPNKIKNPKKFGRLKTLVYL